MTAQSPRRGATVSDRAPPSAGLVPRVTLHNEAHRRRAHQMVDAAPLGYRVSIADPKHSDEQRSKLNAMCGDIAKQAAHHGVKFGKDDWRHLISAAVFKQRIVPDLDGNGFVSLTPSTAKMSIKQMVAMIEMAQFLGDSKGVIWTDPKLAEAA
jgi:hypothetical protein